MSSYLFIHSGMNRQRHNPIDAYWKGLVVQIRTLTSQPALVRVRWLWGKEDIASEIEGQAVDPKLMK